MKKWNTSMQFPTDSSFKNRITDAAFGPSKSTQRPMITIVTEVQEPQEYEIDGEPVTIAGVKDTMYMSTTSFKADGSVDEEKTENQRNRIKDLWKRLELNPDEINWDNIDVKPLKGLLVFTMMSPDDEIQRKNPTSEQLRKNPKAQGDVMKNPITGEPLVKYYPKVREIFGVVPGSERAAI